MEAVIGNLEEILECVAELAVLLFKYIGAVTIICAGIKAVINGLKKDPKTRLLLSEGLALSLSFLLVSEILETAVIGSMQQISVVGGIFILRAAMSVLLHWESKNEKEELSGEHHSKKA